MKGRIFIIIVCIVLICSCRSQKGHTPMSISNCCINDDEKSTTKSFDFYDINSCLYPILDSICVKVKSLPQFTHCDFAFELDCQNNSLNNRTEIIIGIIQGLWNNNYSFTEGIAYHQGHYVLLSGMIQSALFRNTYKCKTIRIIKPELFNVDITNSKDDYHWIFWVYGIDDNETIINLGYPDI